MAIVVEDLHHVYLEGTRDAVRAVDGVSLTIEDGAFVGLIGPTGSGKSTLVQHLNGLLRPTSGRVLVDGQDIWNGKLPLREVRRRVGLVFQFPEHQLFEETVFDDVAFGPRNLGLDPGAVRERVEEALRTVGLDPGEFGPRPPFALSGGQMRRVAIAGVLAMRPRTLVLDEPASGLDPSGRRELFEYLRAINAAGTAVVLVSHNMDDVARLAERVVVMDRGRVVLEGPTRQVFADAERLRALGLDAPPVTRLAQALYAAGCPVPPDLVTVDEAAEAILAWKRGAGG